MNQYKAGDGRKTYRTVVHAISSLIGEEMPSDIQYLPPGKHNINATKNGKPTELEVEVIKKTASELQKSFDKITASGLEQVFIDFNHEDAEASAWLKGFYWGGDDPVDGGVRAKVEWTSAGKDSLLGKNFRKFSPTFTVNSRGEIDGTTLNAGGLVNRPAFKEITPVIAVEYREGEAPIIDMIKHIRSQEIEEEEKEVLTEEEVLEEEKELEVSSEEIVEEEEEEKIESIEELKEKVNKPWRRAGFPLRTRKCAQSGFGCFSPTQVRRNFFSPLR
jgi:phage I-like protein